MSVFRSTTNGKVLVCCFNFGFISLPQSANFTVLFTLKIILLTIINDYSLYFLRPMIYDTLFLQLVIRAEKSKHQAVRNKYGSSKFMSVSSLDELERVHDLLEE